MSLTDGLSLAWNAPGDVPDAAEFAGRVIGDEPNYISHGEIQAGLSDDGQQWVDNLAERYAQDFADGEGRDHLVVRDGAGDVVGLLIIAYEASKRRAFAVIEDMAVAPQMRSHGVGVHMLRKAEERIRTRGIEWVFLESGLRNEGAHRFFEEQGFGQISQVFGKTLAPL